MDRQNRRVPPALWSPGQQEVLGSELSCPTYRPARGSGCLSLTQNTGRENTHTPSRSSPHTHTHHRHSLAHTCTHTHARKYPYAHASHIAHSLSTPPHTHTQSTRRHHTLTPHTHTHTYQEDTALTSLCRVAIWTFYGDPWKSGRETPLLHL